MWVPRVLTLSPLFFWFPNKINDQLLFYLSHLNFSLPYLFSTKHSETEKRERKKNPKLENPKEGKIGKDLSDDQITSMKEAFTLFDTDNDSKIAPSELGILILSLGSNPTQAQLNSIVAEENLTSPFEFSISCPNT